MSLRLATKRETITRKGNAKTLTLVKKTIIILLLMNGKFIKRSTLISILPTTNYNFPKLLRLVANKGVKLRYKETGSEHYIQSVALAELPNDDTLLIVLPFIEQVKRTLVGDNKNVWCALDYMWSRSDSNSDE